MTLSDHQKSILSFLSTVEYATKEEIYKNTNLSYYLNWAKHTGDVLNRMVKRGLIERVGYGKYAICKTGKPVSKDHEYDNPNQMKLL